jgi:pantoate--beta-alanine ligase
MTQVIKTSEAWRALRTGDLKDHSIGFVPTMGSLHAGHVSLIKRSLQENAITVVSIFVNPTQFNDPKDLERYPRKDEEDLALLRSLQVDYVFFPDYKTLYPDDYQFRVTESIISSIMEGSSRPGHFDGVLTVVMRLLNIIQPTRSYFGEKDYQQYLLIREMVRSFLMPVEIIPCPTVRDADGLALSSRNVLLTPEDRQKAPMLFRLLSSTQSTDAIMIELERHGFHVDYIIDYEGRRFGAVYLGKVRLIDNVPLNETH